MTICSKCGKKIPKNAIKCPHCHKIVNKPLPPKNIKVKSVPLKVKKVKTARTKIEVVKPNLSYFNNWTIFFIIALVLINLVLLSNFLTQQQNQPKVAENNEQTSIEVSKLGSWKDQNNSLFIFTQDNNFYWYNSYLVQNDNYYKGTYNYKVGLAALEEMGYTEEEFYITFGNDLSLDNVYSINLFPTTLIENQIDVSSTKLAPNESWWYLLIIKNDETAVAYNKTLDSRYNLTIYNSR